MDKDIQQAVLKAGRESTIAQRAEMELVTANALEELKNKDDPVKFYEVDKGPFKDRIKSVYENNAERVGGMDVIEEVGRQ